MFDKIGYTNNINILIVWAWFHDICNGDENREILGATNTCELLKELCSETQLFEIRKLISLHDSRKNEDLTIETKILQDADFLDHFGIFEVWCTFQYVLKEDMSMIEVSELMCANYKEQFELERNLLHFEVSKNIYDEKKQYIRNFITRLRDESSGKIIDFSTNP